MSSVCEKKNCTGCMACYNICPRKAISIKSYKGFYYPEINEEKCINCGLCRKTCPALNPIKKNKPMDNKCYALLNKEKKIRDNSSSGGVFYELAKYIINTGGVVYGASWDESLVVNHIRIDKPVKISLLQGSKYVQSNIKDIFKSVKQDLDNKKQVLFSGVPCQISGLKLFLKKKYENLYTVEVLCHGSASPIVFEEHKKYLEKKYNDKLKAINFRFKTEKKCQNIEYNFQNSKILLEDPLKDYYYLGFQDGTLDRDCCYNCKYVGIERCSDITLADFWGLKDDSFACKDKLSYPSLIFINTTKGLDLFNSIKDKFEIKERPIQEAIDGNLSLRRAVPNNKVKEKFLVEYDKKGYEIAAQKYLIIKKDYKYYIKKILGRKISQVLMKVMKR